MLGSVVDPSLPGSQPGAPFRLQAPPSTHSTCKDPAPFPHPSRWQRRSWEQTCHLRSAFPWQPPGQRFTLLPATVCPDAGCVLARHYLTSLI